MPANIKDILRRELNKLNDSGMGASILDGLQPPLEPEQKAFVLQEFQDAHTFLQGLAEKNFDEASLEARLRHFLKVRWAYIHHRTPCYTKLRTGPMNLACISLAEAIVKEGEPIARVLMPSLVIDDYQVSASSLQELTEKDLRSGRRLHLDNVIVSEELDAVIPVEECLANAEKNSHTLSHQYMVGNAPAPLSIPDIEQLQLLTGQSSLELFAELSNQRRLRDQPGALIGAIEALCKAGNHSARARDGGSELNASDKFRNAVIKFHTKTWMQFPENVRTTLGRLKVKRGNNFTGYSLESYLLKMRAGVDNDQTRLTEAEQQRVLRDNIFCCMDIAGNQVREILKTNLKTFQQYSKSDHKSLEKAVQRIGVYFRRKKNSVFRCDPDDDKQRKDSVRQDYLDLMQHDPAQPFTIVLTDSQQALLTAEQALFYIMSLEQAEIKNFVSSYHKSILAMIEGEPTSKPLRTLLKILLKHSFLTFLTPQRQHEFFAEYAHLGWLDVCEMLLSSTQFNANMLANEDCVAPIHTIARHGDLRLLETIIAKSIDVNAPEYATGKSALHLLVMRGNLDILKALLKTPSIDVSFKDKSGHTALFYVLGVGAQKREEITKLLMEHGARLSEADLRDLHANQEGLGLPSLRELITANELNIIIGILPGNALNFSLQDGNGNSYLYRAVVADRHEMVRTMLSEGAKFTDEDKKCLISQGKHHWLSIPEAARACRADVLSVLLCAKDANINEKASGGYTALHFAARRNWAAGVELLLNHVSCEKSLLDARNHSPLYYAILHSCDRSGYNAAPPELIPLMLFKAGARLSDSDAVELAIPNMRDENLLQIAVRFKCADFVRYVLSLDNIGLDYDHVSVETRYSALHWVAVKEQSMDVLKVLCESRKLNLSVLDGRGHTAVFESLTDAVGILSSHNVVDFMRKRASITQYLFSMGAQLAPAEMQRLSNTSMGDHFKPIFQNLPELVAKLLEEYPELIKIYADGNMGLSRAAMFGAYKTAKLLCTYPGIDISQEHAENESPLYLALIDADRLDHRKIARLLVRKGAKLSDYDLRTMTGKPNIFKVLHHAVSLGFHAVVRQLLGANVCQVNAGNLVGETALHIAAKCGHFDIVRDLCAKDDIIISPVDALGHTPIYYAFTQLWQKRDRTQIIELLAEKKASLSAADLRELQSVGPHGMTGLHYAARAGSAIIARQILADSAENLNDRLENGMTPLHLAAANGHVEVVELLCATEGIDLTAADEKGLTPLCYAIKLADVRNADAVVDILLAKVPHFKARHLNFLLASERALKSRLPALALLPTEEPLRQLIIEDKKSPITSSTFPSGNTLLHLLPECMGTRPLELYFEINPDADPSPVNRQNQTPLSIAVHDPAKAEVLQRHGAKHPEAQPVGHLALLAGGYQPAVGERRTHEQAFPDEVGEFPPLDDLEAFFANPQPETNKRHKQG